MSTTKKLGGSSLIFAVASGLVLTLSAGPKPAGPSGYQLVKTVPIPGDGFWDYVGMDSNARRIYISHGTRVQVLDADSFAVVGEIPDTQGVHGIAIAPDLGRGFTSNGSRRSRSMPRNGEHSRKANKDKVRSCPAMQHIEPTVGPLSLSASTMPARSRVTIFVSTMNFGWAKPYILTSNIR